jgi:hypothetical protein
MTITAFASDERTVALTNGRSYMYGKQSAEKAGDTRLFSE